MLQAQVSTMVQSLHRQLREKSIKTRQGCFALLTELVIVMPGALNDHLHLIVPGILFSLGDKNSSSNMKIDTLSFINVVVCNHQPHFFHKHIPTLLPVSVACLCLN
jgi:cullin-associated NEDD8-dissociated protein 1